MFGGFLLELSQGFPDNPFAFLMILRRFRKPTFPDFFALSTLYLTHERGYRFVRLGKLLLRILLRYPYNHAFRRRSAP